MACHGWEKLAIDPTKWVLLVLEMFGQVWAVVKPPEFEVLPLEVRIPEGSLINKSEPENVLATVV